MAMFISIIDSARASSSQIKRDYQAWPHVFWSVSLAVAEMAGTAPYDTFVRADSGGLSCSRRIPSYIQS
jgi:hypothetical protein